MFNLFLQHVFIRILSILIFRKQKNLFKYLIINTKKETTRADVFKTFIKDNRSRWPNICTVFEGYFKSGSMIDVMKAYYNPLMTFTPNEKQLCLMDLWGFDKDEMIQKFESKSKNGFILDGLT